MQNTWFAPEMLFNQGLSDFLLSGLGLLEFRLRIPPPLSETPSSHACRVEDRHFVPILQLGIQSLHVEDKPPVFCHNHVMTEPLFFFGIDAPVLIFIDT
jgi:hypothetical protein